MNSRLIWNIEIHTGSLLDISTLSDEKDKIRYESRFFWSANEIITLHGLDEGFLALANYEIKHHDDCYLVSTEHNYNIKQRHNELVYKPLLQTTETLKGYGNKIKLNNFPPEEALPGTKGLHAPMLLAQLKKKSLEIKVTKDLLVYKFPTQPKIKLELSRLDISDRIYYSICVEGRSQRLVTTIANHLLKKQVACDYVSFLKQTLAL